MALENPDIDALSKVFQPLQQHGSKLADAAGFVTTAGVELQSVAPISNMCYMSYVPYEREKCYICRSHVKADN